MKKGFLILLPMLVFVMACNNTNNTAEQKEEQVALSPEEMQNKTFRELFEKIDAKELPDNVFKLFGDDHAVITSGEESDFNSMTAGWGGFGILFQEPATWCFLRANRYTLEYMREKRTYTLCFFPDEHKEQVLYFGTRTGRDNPVKMKEQPLMAVATPDGNMAYKEARLIIECEIAEVTTVSPDDFYTENGKKFVEDGFEEAGDYHKMVFGTITNVWVKR